ncbi:AprI/Inh family metalloprotease inhibitor [Paracoccus sp. p3-h83]|uniref:AprI/Inh family metalloprotease inhibitor n=1 Tax=Paracoccus sp. p3-h83 TaxID=3342805 RepID=UPI0035BA9DFF
MIRLMLPLTAVTMIAACVPQAGVELGPRGVTPIAGVESSHGNVTTTVTTAPNVTTTVTTSRHSGASAGGGIRSDALVAGLIGGLLAQPAAPSLRGTAGRWNVREADGRVCTVDLSTQDRFGRRDLSQTGCFGAPMVWANGWVLRGDKIVLNDAANNEIATLSRATDGTWTGAGVTLYR